MIRLAANLSVILLLLLFTQQGHTEVTLLAEGEYRLGDSPQTPEAGLAWLSAELNSPEWRPFQIVNGHSSDGFDHAWRRFRLPALSIENPTLYLSDWPAFEAYLDGDLIYRSGEQRASPQNKVMHHAWHLVSLPPDFGGKTIYFRVYSEYDHWLEHPGGLSIAPQSEHFLEMVRSELAQTVVSAFLLLIGIACVYIYVRRGEPAARSLAILSGCVGLFSIMHTDIAWMVFEPSIVTWYVEHIPLFVFPVGLWLFLNDLVQGNCPIMKKLALVQVAFAASAILLDVANVYPMIMTTPYLVLLSLSLAVSGICTFWHLYQTQSPTEAHTQDRKLLLVGYGLLAAGGTHDLLAGFRVIPFILPLFHFGVLGFVIFLAIILERHFARAHDRLQDYSTQLEEANRTLEHRVDERTADLATKNHDLQKAMGDLRDTQQQLVMREKMASLGDLVAGVAHEVNTPIGAVNSSADVANRCIEKLEGVIDQSRAADELKSQRPYQQAIQLLKDNAGLIQSAGERIATIVRSLRSFARLDEAEYQSANIHLGLDSTLDLVNHELKNRIEVVKEYGDLPMIDCFPNKLNQVFMNLLINASQAIEETGTITLSTEHDGDEIVILISDTGKGISAENLEKIFDPGFTTKGVGIGTGLGLAISYAIIEDHRGSISADSRLGQGTTFTIRLPVHGEEQDR